ncbi:hypothetical protein PHJA_000094900 [Phtheirospermum japonicum]|uniref:Uncharacterized protein n=1 Tax=Phtheirospermum japonicum TaxID=374723 RepID=A0A830B4Q0_9LAMI|nr:hypothetical protein PHJA_000094900 [Phtheirospermum japonicum]
MPLVSADIRPPPPRGPQTPIAILKDDFAIKALAEILVNSDELVQKAKQILAGIPKCGRGVEKFSNVVHEFWLSRCFINGLCQAIEGADPLFKPSLTSLESAATTTTDIMRVFLSILIGYWGDKGELTKLDEAMGKADFGKRMSLMAYIREEEKKKGKAPEERENLESVRQWLVSKYGNDNNVDIDALHEKLNNMLESVPIVSIRSQLLSNLKIGLQAGLYDGKMALVHLRVIDGCLPSMTMECTSLPGV